MRTEIIAAKDVSGELARRYNALRDAAWDALKSPYFCEEFVRLVGEVRDDAHVLVCEQGGEVSAFLPFQRHLGRVARPLGGPLSDYQALIAEPDGELDVRGALRSAHLDVLLFDHWVATQPFMHPFATRRARSPFMDLSQGFAAYERAQRASGSELLPTIRRRARKLAREVGPLRYESHVDDPRVLEQVLAWKTQQSELTGSERLFEHRWARELIARIHQTRTDAFAGMLSALWAGDQLVAGHFGMRSRSVWHYWFPSYDRAFAKYSPGLCLLLHMAEAAPQLGIDTIDFGKGEQRYKSELMSGAVDLLEGRVFTVELARQAVDWAERLADAVRTTPLVAPARYPARLVRRMRAWAEYR